MTGVAGVSSSLSGLSERAEYSFTPLDSAGMVVLWSNRGGEVRLHLRLQEHGWFELTRAERGDAEDLMLRAMSTDVVEHFLAVYFLKLIRGRTGLELLRLPWSVNDVADGYSVTDPPSDGNRTLSSRAVGVIAEAEDPTVSLITLVPLSHYLQFTLPELETAFLSPDGAPLLSGGDYTR